MSVKSSSCMFRPLSVLAAPRRPHLQQDRAMHRSRLTAVLVDVPAVQFEPVTRFWSGALGQEVEIDDEDPEYASLGRPVPGLQFMVQSVGSPPRIHIDIETADVEAEVKRIEVLGE